MSITSKSVIIEVTEQESHWEVFGVFETAGVLISIIVDGLKMINHKLTRINYKLHCKHESPKSIGEYVGWVL